MRTQFKYFYYRTNGGTYRLKIARKAYRNERYYFEYAFSDQKGQIIFQGDDFSVGIWKEINRELSNELVSFLCLRPGDTDAEYFDNYTPIQLAFRDSLDCEEISWQVAE